MRIRRLLYLAGWLLLATCSPAGAQDSSKTGLTIGYPGSVGFIWHATDTVAIRPAFAFAHSDSEITTGPSETESTSIALDLGVLFYLKKYDNVRTYISPRFVYSRSTSSTTTNLPVTVPDTTTTGISTGGAGVFGAQYTPTGRFNVFGEVGFAFSHRHTDSGLGASEFKTNTWGTTAGVGVIFYF